MIYSLYELKKLKMVFLLTFYHW